MSGLNYFVLIHIIFHVVIYSNYSCLPFRMKKNLLFHLLLFMISHMVIQKVDQILTEFNYFYFSQKRPRCFHLVWHYNKHSYNIQILRWYSFILSTDLASVIYTLGLWTRWHPQLLLMHYEYSEDSPFNTRLCKIHTIQTLSQFWTDLQLPLI